MVQSEPFLVPNVVTNFPTNSALRNEIQRLEQLKQVVLSANPVGFIAPIPPFLQNENPLQYRLDGKPFDHMSGGFSNGPLGGRNQDRPVAMLNDKNAYLHLRKPPPVSGGRGFFQDFKESNKGVLDFNDEACRDHSNTGSSWCDKDKRVVDIGQNSDGGYAKSNDVTNRGTSPTDFNSSSRSRSHRDKDYGLPLKRRSDDYDGDRTAKEIRREKQVLCGTQLRLGECHHSFCRLVHLTPSEMEEVSSWTF